MSVEAMKQTLDAFDAPILADEFEDRMQRRKACDALRQAIQQAEGQEPIGWITEDYKTDKSATTYDKTVAERWKNKGWPVNPIYTTSPQREWVGLTDEEVEAEINEAGFGCVNIARAIEAKLKEKNYAS